MNPRIGWGWLVLAACLGASVLGQAGTVESLVREGLAAYGQKRLPEARQKLLQAVIGVQNEMPLVIQRVVPCKEIREYDDFTPLDTPALKAGETLLLYIEPAHLRIHGRPDGKFETWFSEDLVLKNEQGQVLLEKKNWLNLHQVSAMPALYTFIRNSVSDLPAGDYTVDITVNDLLAKTLVSYSLKVAVR